LFPIAAYWLASEKSSSASQHDPELRAYYQHKRGEGKRHEVALSHLMRILTRRLVAVLRSGKPYQSNQIALQNAALNYLQPVIALSPSPG